jgi:Helix-turn-helix domain of transposase family ISL3/zinc-finger of transposase IS204/IS1001/IS1096/IS1165
VRASAARETFLLLVVGLALLDSRRRPRCLAVRSGRGERPTSGQGGGARRGAPTVPASDSRNRCERNGGDVRPLRVWKQLLGLRRTVIEQVEFDETDDVLVVSVRPRAKEQDRCPHCRRRCPGYDQGEGRRRWRALDLATTFCFLEADAPRVDCRRHGVVVAAVPWARHDAGFTRSFEDQTAWLTVNTSKTAVSELMRIAWRTVGWICARVAAEAQAQRDLFADLTRRGR